jgi:16S rRNA (cytosine967-C5)-methyltransferase
MLGTALLINLISPARISAYQVLTRVAEGAYASDALMQETRGLEGRDAGLASQIVFGCLRFQAQLDYLITRYSGRQLVQIEPQVVISLRMAVFQLRYLDRIPPHAAVNETVELVKRGNKRGGGFVNAVLRKVNRKPVRWPDVATELCCPEWILQRWRAQFGPDRAAAIAQAALEEPQRFIRLPPGSEIPEEVQAECTPVEGCFLLLSPTVPGTRLQDISSQAIIPLLQLQPGHRYLDLCAAPGNKTIQALETPLALAVACDINETRARQIPPVCPRVVLDAGRRLPFRNTFDRIFVDAPCSGTGTLARNPEIKWRVKETDFQRFQEKQVRIVSAALESLAPGGRLVYATCSLEREENEDVVERILRGNSSVQWKGELRRLPGRDAGDGFYSVALERYE